MKQEKIVFKEHSQLIYKILYLSTSILPSSNDDMMLLCPFFFSPFSVLQRFEVSLAGSLIKFLKKYDKDCMI